MPVHTPYLNSGRNARPNEPWTRQVDGYRLPVDDLVRPATRCATGGPVTKEHAAMDRRRRPHQPNDDDHETGVLESAAESTDLPPFAETAHAAAASRTKALTGDRDCERHFGAVGRHRLGEPVSVLARAVFKVA